MGIIVRLPRTAALAAVFLGFAAVTLRAEPLPLPSADYATTAKMAGGMTMMSRHSKGKIRVEMQVPGMPSPMTAYIDLRAKKAVTVMAAPGMGNMAIEADLGDGDEFGVAVGRGNRVGNATVAGETCDLWEIESDQKDIKKSKAVACLTSDSIPLRMEATIDGKRQVVFEVTELSRAPQDPKLFSPSANLKPMRLPKGMMPPTGK
ncbi:MAG: hypothetical protein WD871_07955 [Xanthobacteraceae bacterium]